MEFHAHKVTVQFCGVRSFKVEDVWCFFVYVFFSVLIIQELHLGCVPWLYQTESRLVG